MENAKKFFEELAKTEEAKAIFATMEKPADDVQLIVAYIDVAAKLGVSLTVEEVKEYLASDKANGAELDDEELSQLAGGGDNANCKSTYQHRENCWWNDGCDMYTNDYDGYKCASQDYGKKPGSTNRTTMIFK